MPLLDRQTLRSMGEELMNSAAKRARDDAFFDELLNVSEDVTKEANAPAPKVGLSGRGALIGGAIGAGLGGLRSFGQEAQERAADDRAGLSDEKKKELRKRRLAGHAANVLAWGGAGAGIGSMEHKAKAILERGKKGATDLIDDAAISANQVMEDAPWNMAKGVVKMPKRAVMALINKIRRKP